MEKLKKIAKFVADSVDGDSMQDLYHKFFEKVVSKQELYFRYLGPVNTIKVFFYVYSIKTTGSTKLGNLINENLYFFELCISEEGLRTNCEKCEGYGEVICEKCKGEGYLNYNREVDDYDEMCKNCEGRGDLICDECGGTGDIESDTKRYVNFYQFCYWDRSLKTRLFNANELVKPVFNEDEFFEIFNGALLLYENTTVEETFIEVDKYYCSELFTNSEKLHFSPSTNFVHINNNIDYIKQK